MGAASSVDMMKQLSMKDNIYISYANKDIYGGTIHDELIRKCVNVIKGRLICSKNETEMGLFICSVSEIMSYSKIIIICISEKTISSFHQAIEINKALDSNKNILYIFTDIHFTPISTPYLNSMVGFNKWLPAYDGPTLEIALDELNSYADI